MLHQHWAMRSGAIAVALSAGLYLAIALVFTYPLISHLDSGILRNLDTEDAFEQTWVVAWVQHVILTHHASLFDAPIYYPARDTLAYQDNLIPIAILTLPLYLAWHNPLIVYNVALIVAFPLSALAMYALAYHLARHHGAAFLAGLIFAYSPYRERHVEHLNQSSAEAVPLIILTFELARTSGGNLRWLAFGLSLALCTTLSVYYLMFTVLGLACYVAVLAFHRCTVVSRAGRSGLWGLAAGLAVFVLALLPYLTTQRTVGGERKLQEVVFFSSDVRDFLHAAPQSLLYGWTDGFWRIAPFEVRQYMFPGWTALVLALLGGWWTFRRRRSRCDSTAITWPLGRAYLATALLVAIFEMGPYLRLFGSLIKVPMPYMAIYTLVPGYAGFRDIGRMDQVMLVFLCGAAAIGAARLLALVPARAARRVLLLLAVLIVLENWVIQRPLLPVASGTAVAPVYRWLATQPAGVVAELPMCHLPGAPCIEEAGYMYYSTYHWHPLVNGGGGFSPADWDATTGSLLTFPSAAAIDTLRAHQVRYLVIHPSFQHIAAVRTFLAAHPSGGPAFRSIKRLGTDLVLELAPWR
jgi:hypothetical protein